MNWSFIVKINVLVLALLGVVFVMRSMQSGPGPSTLAALLGAPPPPAAPSEPTRGAATTLDWCNTRVSALERPGKPTIRQIKLQWYLEDKLLEFIPVEKWFGRNCRVIIDRVSPSEFDAATAKPVLVVKFIKGEPETLMAAGNIYRWEREIFRSSELDQALVDLDTLPLRQQGIDKK